MGISIRLTKEMRQEIATAVLAHSFAGEEAKLEKRATLLGLQVWKYVLGTDLGILENQPQRWFQHEERWTYYVDGLLCPFCYVWSSDEGRNIIAIRREAYKSRGWPIVFPAPAPIPYYMNQGVNQTISINSEPGAAAESLAADVDAYRERYDEAAARVSGILTQFTTTAKLAAAWPEVVPFLPAAEVRPPVPAIPVAELNTLLGL